MMDMETGLLTALGMVVIGFFVFVVIQNTKRKVKDEKVLNNAQVLQAQQTIDTAKKTSSDSGIASNG